MSSSFVAMHVCRCRCCLLVYRSLMFDFDFAFIDAMRIAMSGAELAIGKIILVHDTESSSAPQHDSNLAPSLIAHQREQHKMKTKTVSACHSLQLGFLLMSNLVTLIWRNRFDGVLFFRRSRRQSKARKTWTKVSSTKRNMKEERCVGWCANYSHFLIRLSLKLMTKAGGLKIELQLSVL